MARKRMIDPSFWSDDKVIELTLAQRLMFIGMWNFADDQGVFRNNEKVVKATIFPADSLSPKKVRSMMDDLIELGLLLVNVEGDLLQIANWLIYQKIDRPQPAKYEFVERSSNDRRTIVPNRIEKNRIEKNKGKPNSVNDVILYFKEKNIVSPDDNATKFFAYYESQGWKKANGRPVLNWKQCVATWTFERSDGSKAPIKHKVICQSCEHKFDTEVQLLSSIKCSKCSEYGIMSLQEWKIESKNRGSQIS